MRFCSIASGSSGNCTYIGSGDTNLIVDAGISGKRIELGLSGLSVEASGLDGILITHEHLDHIKGLGVMTRRYGLPIYASRGTIEALLTKKDMANTPQELFHEVRADESFKIKDMVIDPIRISHDAAEPVAYRFNSGKSAAAVVTDLGTYDNYILDRLNGVSALLLEANHDVRMVEAGNYPYYLKQRILSGKGHLSNDTAATLTLDLIDRGEFLRYLLLGHLSKENNLEELAYETVRMELKMIGGGSIPKDFRLSVAKRNECSECVEV
ncbi:MAG: MBL fold metallo-hydrolase [Lachnospiraceae bacterium]|nr:MBL fold metallo-hydrolase [Lachnospiraceae bacterium]MDN4743194.1 MBL fold metallo-hydrolase [Lachnospiraceae bacterium C1.1]